MSTSEIRARRQGCAITGIRPLHRPYLPIRLASSWLHHSGPQLSCRRENQERALSQRVVVLSFGFGSDILYRHVDQSLQSLLALRLPLGVGRTAPLANHGHCSYRYGQSQGTSRWRLVVWWRRRGRSQSVGAVSWSRLRERHSHAQEARAAGWPLSRSLSLPSDPALPCEVFGS